MRMAILVPGGQGLAAELNYLPAVVQGVFVTDIAKYSAIDVLDRQNLEQVLKETESGLYKSEDDFVQLGQIANVSHAMTGSITKTGSGYALQIQVAGTADGLTKASYSGNCTAVELDNFTAIKKASAELLAGLGVVLKEQAKMELAAAAAAQEVSGQTALARGITSQKSGTTVEAMTYYYEAVKFDPDLIEASKRVSVMSTAITSGNLGRELIDDIQLRNEWLKILREAAAYYKAHPPFEIIYNPALEQGHIDYDKRTVGISFKAGLYPQESGFKVLYDLQQGFLKATAEEHKFAARGLVGWPESEEAPVFDRGLSFRVTAVLINEDGRTIGRAETNMNPRDAWDTNLNNLYFSGVTGSFLFRDVDASAITDKLTVSIASVNGMDTKTAAERGYISVRAADPEGFLYTVEWGKNSYGITWYSGPGGTVVIPASIDGRTINFIRSAFRDHSQLTGIVIPASVIYIGDSAFARVQLRSITIGANVYIEQDTFERSFIAYYNLSGKKAGRYEYTGNVWTYAGSK